MKCNSVFMIHKPAGVVCATVDSNLGNVIRNKKDERCGLKKIVEPRLTVYELAHKAGFPDNFGLVGRLDTETSGVILFTSQSDLLRKVKDPPLSESEYSVQYVDSNVSFLEYYKVKSKQYELLMLSGKTVSAQLALNGGCFDANAFEDLMSQPFTFSRNGEEISVGASVVNFIERYQDPKYSHGKAELGWCIRCSIVLHEG